MKTFKSDFKLTFNESFGENRRFKSQILTNNIIDLMLTRFLIYSIDMINNPLNPIILVNGIQSDEFYLEIISNGQKINWHHNIYWSNNVIPLSSEIGNKDIYRFLCIGSEKYLGQYSYGFNY